MGRARAFFALADLERDLLVFVQRGPSGHLDFRMVDEQILSAIVGSNPSEPLTGVPMMLYSTQ